MSTYAHHKRTLVGSIPPLLRRLTGSIQIPRAAAIGAIIVGALVFFELFNFSTTEFALSDLLGELRFFGIAWSTILAIAFCSIDFAGIAKIFTGGPQASKSMDTWYLLGAWFLAATMNALLTWWSISLALLNHPGLGNEILTREELITWVPLFVALLVWLIRVLMIGMFTLPSRAFSRSRSVRGARSTFDRGQPADHQAPEQRQPYSQRNFQPAPKPKPNGQRSAERLNRSASR